MDSLTLFVLSDASGQEVQALGKDISFIATTQLFARTAEHPTITFSVKGAIINGILTTVTPKDVAKLHHYYEEKLSLYRVDGQSLSFRRNLRACPDLVHWIHKQKGTYVLFKSGGDMRAMELPTNKHVALRNVPVSHIVPQGAWF